ncbi:MULTISPECIES: YchJ family protein [unclassified Saccharicrinis]|uniref:YchJ family protein n=1 Tax=unclassified Saccharicrinis TaxID=2646859 RepID=UPI003D33D590
MNSICPCGSNKAANICCLPIIKGYKNAQTAEELMRSRYTAFTFADVEYLMASQHSKTRNIKEKKEIKKWAQSVSWIGLSILSRKNGLPNDDSASVEFKAVFMESGLLNHIHEISIFEKEAGKWVYKNGKQLP